MSKEAANQTVDAQKFIPTTTEMQKRIVRFTGAQSAALASELSSTSSLTSLGVISTESPKASNDSDAFKKKMEKAALKAMAKPKKTTKANKPLILAGLLLDKSSESSLKSLGSTVTTSSKASTSSKKSTRISKSLSRKPKSPTKTAAPQPQLTPFFAKRDLSNVPNGVSQQAHLAHTSRIPFPTDTICSCRLPALSPPQYNYAIRLAQCSSTSCAIAWYHYDCLDKAGKLSSRFGKFVCQHCKNLAHFFAQDEDNGWSVEKLVEQELRGTPIKGEDLVVLMPGLGGSGGVVKPYGLGAVVQEEDDVGVEKPAAGRLGELSFFGYASSRPFMLVEAYVKGTAHLYLEAPVSVAEDEYDAYEEEEYEYEYEGGGEWGEYGEGQEEEEEVCEEIDEGEDVEEEADDVEEWIWTNGREIGPSSSSRSSRQRLVV